MDKGGRSYFPCLLMLVIMQSMPLTNLSTNESTDISMDFESSILTVIFIGVASLPFPHILLEYLLEKNEK